MKYLLFSIKTEVKHIPAASPNTIPYRTTNAKFTYNLPPKVTTQLLAKTEPEITKVINIVKYGSPIIYEIQFPSFMVRPLEIIIIGNTIPLTVRDCGPCTSEQYDVIQTLMIPHWQIEPITRCMINPPMHPTIPLNKNI